MQHLLIFFYVVGLVTLLSRTPGQKKYWGISSNRIPLLMCVPIMAVALFLKTARFMHLLKVMKVLNIENVSRCWCTVITVSQLLCSSSIYKLSCMKQQPPEGRTSLGVHDWYLANAPILFFAQSLSMNKMNSLKNVAGYYFYLYLNIQLDDIYYTTERTHSPI